MTWIKVACCPRCRAAAAPPRLGTSSQPPAYDATALFSSRSAARSTHASGSGIPAAVGAAAVAAGPCCSSDPWRCAWPRTLAVRHQRPLGRLGRLLGQL